MRADRTTQDDRIFSAAGQASWLRVDVRDFGGTFRDLDSQRGYSFVEKATWSLSSDQPIATATVDVRREIFKLSLAPDVASSVLNALGGGTQLLLPNAQIRLYGQIQSSGVAPDPSKWTQIFDGVIDDVDSGQDPIVLNCSDFSKRVDERWIEDERAYGVWQPGQRYIGSATVGAVVVPPPSDPTAPNNGDAPTGPWLRCTGTTGIASAPTWQASHSYAALTTVTPSVPNGYAFISGPGTHTSGGTEPAWAIGVGAQTIDGAVTWSCVQVTPPVWPLVINGTVSDNGMTWTCVAEAGIVGAPARANGTVYATGTFVAPGNGFVYKNKGASGTSAGAPPVFSTTLGSTTTDNTVTWTNVGQITATPLETQIQMVLDDNLGSGSGWTLKVPVATGEVIRPYTQSCQSTLQACQNIANIIGWDLRYKWDSGSSSFQLTLYNPNRATTTSLYTVSPNKYYSVDSLKRDITNIRNVIRVFFWDQVSVDSSGNPVLSHADQIDATSLALYGRLFASISEPAGSAINSLTAAVNMAAAVVSDLGMPPIDVSTTIDFAWWFEPTDLITLSADGLHFDSDQKLAIYSLAHTLGQGSDRSETKIGLRGKPCSGHWRWNEIVGVVGQNGGPAKVLPLNPPPLPGLTGTIAGAGVTWPIPADSKRYLHTEVHISTSNGFTPSSNTLAAVTRAGRKDFAPGAIGSPQTGVITQGVQYFVRLVHKQLNGTSTPPGPQAAVTAGYANLVHLNPNITQNAAATIALDKTFPSNADYIVPLDTALVNHGSIFAAGTGIFTAAFAGTFLVAASAPLSGGSPGDCAVLVVDKLISAVWTPVASSWYAPYISGPGGGPLCVPQFTAIIPGVVATDQFRLRIVPRPKTGSVTWTVQGLDGGAGFGAAQMAMVQLLSG